MIRWMLCIWFLFAAPTFVIATEIQPEVDSILEQPALTLPDLFRLAELRNPALAVAQATATANAGRARQAGLYPNPRFEFEIEEMSTEDSGIRKEKMTLEQPLIISGRRGDAVAAANAGQAASVYDLEQQRRDLYRRIHALWAGHLYFREADEALADLLDIANQTLEIARVRFEARAAPESNVTKALLEVYELEMAQQRLAQQKAGAEAELFALLGGRDVPLSRIEGTLGRNTLGGGLDTEDILPPPAQNAAASRIQEAQAALSESKAERVPDLGLFASYGRVRPTGENFIEGGISIPIPLFNRNQGRVAEKSALLAKAQAQARRVETNFQAKLAAGQARHLAMGAELRVLDERMLPTARRGLTQAQDGYRVGRLPLLELIDAQRTLSSIRLRNLELKRDLVIAEADLLILAGRGPFFDTGERP
jgi:outer membrane protein, heavy metal efflux system